MAFTEFDRLARRYEQNELELRTYVRVKRRMGERPSIAEARSLGIDTMWFTIKDGVMVIQDQATSARFPPPERAVIRIGEGLIHR